MNEFSLKKNKKFGPAVWPAIANIFLSEDYLILNKLVYISVETTMVDTM